MFATIGLWLAKYAVGRFIRANWPAMLAAVLAGGVWWLVDEIGDRREASVRAEWKAADDARALAAVTGIANENAAIAMQIHEFAEKKAAVRVARTNRNWEQSERLNNELFAKLGRQAGPGECDAGGVADITAAADWVWREAARAGDPRAVGRAEGGAGSDGADTGAAAAP